MAMPSTSRRNHQLLRWCLSLGAVLVAMAAVACLSWGRIIFVPLALAIILSFLLQPAVRALERMRVPRVPAVVLVVVLVGLVLGAIGWNVAGQLKILAHDLRANADYSANIKSKIADLRKFSSGGVLTDVQAAVDDINSELGETAERASAAPVVVARDEPTQMEALRASLSPLLAPLGTAALVIALVIFMLINREDLRNRIIGLFGSKKLMVTTRAIDDAGRRIGRYLLMQLIINVSYGLILGTVLSLLGVPFALLWGFLAALLRYIPYIGPWLGAALPVATSLMAFEGWFQASLVLCVILGLELFSNMVMEPLLYGHSVGISAVALILAAAFWTWIWGPIGLVLATPLTVCLVVLGQHVPQLRLFAVLLGDEPALPPPMRYYQRLIARDKAEAAALVARSLSEATHPAEAFDTMMMPALLTTRRDRQQGALTAQDEAYILQSTGEILAELSTEPSLSSPEARSGTASPSATSQGAPRPVAASTSSATSMPRFAWANASTRSQGSPAATTTAGPAEPAENGGADRQAIEVVAGQHVLGCPAHHESEELALRMLSYAVRRSEFPLSIVSTRAMYTEILDRVEREEPAAVFIAVIPPSGLAQAVFLCKKLRKHAPELPIVVGYWGNKKRFDQVLVRMRAAGADLVTTSLRQSEKQLAVYCSSSRAKRVEPTTSDPLPADLT